MDYIRKAFDFRFLKNIEFQYSAHRIHLATFFIADFILRQSKTMAAEAAVLGTPSLRF